VPVQKLWPKKFLNNFLSPFAKHYNRQFLSTIKCGKGQDEGGYELSGEDKIVVSKATAIL